MHRTTSPIDDVAEAPSGAGPHLQPQDARAGASFAIRNVLVVCLGNICRSPMAEFLLRKQLPPDVAVLSAGISAVPGTRIDPRALSVLGRHGIDAEAHMARRIEQGMVDAADLVLVMERAHLQFIQSRLPSATGKTFLLGKWQAELEIPDPFGERREAFDDVYRMIELASRQWCAFI